MTRRAGRRAGPQRGTAQARATYPRGEAPTWVALWQRLDPRRDSPEGDALLARLALMCCVPILLAYGAAGLVYGHLPMLTPFGFIDMPGACAWLAATASLALALGAIDWLAADELAPPQPRTVTTSHTLWQAPGQPLRQVELKTTLPPDERPGGWHRRLRAGCLIVAVIACVSAWVGRVLQAFGLDAFAHPVIALAPHAEWPLSPLQWVWPWLLPFARDDVVLGLIGTGVALFVLSQVLSWRKVRRAWLPLGVIGPLLVALSHLGSAAYDFAAARGLGGLRDAELLGALASDPGRHNAYTFLGLWIAIGCLSIGLILGYLMGRSETLDED